MALAIDQVNEIVRSIVRTIDKRAEFSAQSVVEGERATVTGTLSTRKHKTTVTIPVEAVTAAGESAMRRHELRNTLKRTLDRMTFAVTPATSTRMTRPMTTSDGFFKPASQGRRGGGGRR